MSKAILVLDKMPKVCGECDYFKRHYVDEKEETYSACALTEKIIDIDFAEKHRSVVCPLKLLPKKKNSIVYQGEINCDIPIDFLEKVLNQGFDTCIDEILEVENE